MRTLWLVFEHSFLKQPGAGGAGRQATTAVRKSQGNESSKEDGIRKAEPTGGNHKRALQVEAPVSPSLAFPESTTSPTSPGLGTPKAITNPKFSMVEALFDEFTGEKVIS